MKKYLENFKQSADHGAMESGDHSKNGASLKSHTSRDFYNFNFYCHD
jgi:hypothetical protein